MRTTPVRGHLRSTRWRFSSWLTTMTLAGSVIALFAPGAAAASSYEWVDRTAGHPPARFESAMAYDSARQKIVLFGGNIGDIGGDTWEWDGTTWIERNPPTSPPPRRLAGMAYDSARQKIVLFGGCGASFDDCFDDTWEWDGTTWTEVSPDTSPPARLSAAMAYDSTRERTVLFGGVFGGSVFGDTWEWDGTTWTQRSPSTSPPGRADAAMAYDSARQRTVLFGGCFSGSCPDNQTWELNATVGPPTQYLVTVSDDSPVAGEPVDLEAQLADASGNPVSTAGVTVTWTDDPAKGAFDSSTSMTDARGVAKQRYMNWVVKDKYRVTASDGASQGSVEITSVDSLIRNWAFELDANKDGRPDNWGSSSSFTRRSTVKFSGNFAGRHRSTGNVNYTSQQTVTGITGGQKYDFSGRVNVPSVTNDDFTLTIRVLWRNNSGRIGSPEVVKQYSKTSPTGAWDQASKSLTAPTGATKAQIQMVVKKLNATVFVDQFSFREQPA